MTTLTCSACGQPLRDRGPQPNDVRGTVADLAECSNPDCQEFERTRSYNIRPMPAEIWRARKEALLRLVQGAALQPK
jgi:hypothetical protein